MAMRLSRSAPRLLTFPPTKFAFTRVRYSLQFGILATDSNGKVKGIYKFATKLHFAVEVYC